MEQKNSLKEIRGTLSPPPAPLSPPPPDIPSDLPIGR